MKSAFTASRFRASEFREQATLVVEPSDLHAVMAFLRDDESCVYNFLSDVIGIDYLGYPAKMPGRFAVVYNLCSYSRGDRLLVTVYLVPSIPSDWMREDAALGIDSVCDLWNSACGGGGWVGGR